MEKIVHYNGGTHNYYGGSKSMTKVCVAATNSIPVVGEKCSMYKLEFVNGQPSLMEWLTSTLETVSYIGNNVYTVTTCNYIYIVQVG